MYDKRFDLPTSLLGVAVLVGGAIVARFTGWSVATLIGAIAGLAIALRGAANKQSL